MEGAFEVLVVALIFVLFGLLYYYFTRRSANDKFVIPDKEKVLSKKDIRNQKKKASKDIKKKVQTTKSNQKNESVIQSSIVDSSTTDNTYVESKKMLQLEVDPEIIEVQQTGAPDQLRNRKKKSDKLMPPKPILLNKDEHSPVVDTPVEYPHFKVLKDDVEVHREAVRHAMTEESEAKQGKSSKKKSKDTPKLAQPTTEVKVEVAKEELSHKTPPQPAEISKAGRNKKKKVFSEPSSTLDDEGFPARPDSPTQEMLQTINRTAGIRIEGLITNLGGYTDQSIAQLKTEAESYQQQLKLVSSNLAEEASRHKQDVLQYQQECQKTKLAYQENLKSFNTMQAEYARNKDTQVKFNLLQSEFQKKINEVQKFEFENTNLKEKLSSLANADAEIRKLRCEIEDAQKTAENERRASKADRATLQEIKKKYEVLQKDFSAARQAGEGQEEPTSSVSENVEKLTKEIEEQKKKNNTVESQLKSKSQDVESLQDSLQKEQNSMKEVGSKLEESLSKLDSCERQISDLQSSLNQKNTELESLRSSAVTSQSASTSPDTAILEELESLKKKNDELRQKNWEISAAVEVAEKLAEERSKELNEVTSKLNDLSSVTNERDELRRTLSDTEVMLKKLQVSVEEEEEKWRNALTAAETECEEYKQALAAAVNQLKEDRGVTEDVTDLNFAYRCVEKSLTNIVDEMEEKVKEMEGKLSAVSTERDEAIAARDRLSAEISEQKQQVTNPPPVIQNGESNHIITDKNVQQSASAPEPTSEGATDSNNRRISQSSDISASHLSPSTNTKSKESLNTTGDTPKKGKRKGFMKVFNKGEKNK